MWSGSRVWRLASGTCIALLPILIGCTSPVSPGACVNGRDSLGRGPVPYIAVPACSPVPNGDVQCTVNQNETGYCAAPPVDITNVATWTSSDPSIGMFGAMGTAPGYLEVLAPGQVQVSAHHRSLSSSALTVFVTPGSLGTYDVKLDETVFVGSGSTPGVDALVTFRPEGGGGALCRTAKNGNCGVQMRIVINSPVHVTVTKEGYRAWEGTIPGGCLVCGGLVRLEPIS